MHLHPDDAEALRREFHRLVNLSPAELRAWLKTPESRKVGTIRPGEQESVGRQSARRILEIGATPVEDLSDADYAHMKKVIGFCRRHLAQRPASYKTGGDLSRSRWRWSLMNWGHDPTKPTKPASRR